VAPVVVEDISDVVVAVVEDITEVVGVVWRQLQRW
jgi:hypothetical protein